MLDFNILPKLVRLSKLNMQSILCQVRVKGQLYAAPKTTVNAFSI